MRYALDTNIVSYFLKNDRVILERIKMEMKRNSDFVIPPTVYFEIHNWLLANNSKRKMAIFQDIYSSQGIGIIDKEILDIASETKVKLQNEGIGLVREPHWFPLKSCIFSG